MHHKAAATIARYSAHEDYLTNLHGPQILSPFKEYRTNAGLSLQGLSIQTGLSKNALVRAEQGTFSNPLPALSEFWQRRLNISEFEILNAYEDYQFYMRKRNFHYFGSELLYDHSLSEHPFRQLRQNRVSRVDGLPLPVGPDEVARALCLPVDTIRYFEKKFRLQQSVPKAILGTLIFIGYSRSDVHEFSKVYEIWRTERIKLVAHA